MVAKLRIDILSAVPEIFDSVINTSIIRIAREKGLLNFHIHNLHQYSNNKFGHIDDTPYGGGPGMIIRCEPVFRCIEELQAKRKYDEIIYMTADGEKLSQSLVKELSLKENIIILCGHYKGIDQRIRDTLITREISIGDFVLTGGELPAMILVDSVVRLIPGVLGNPDSIFEDSFQANLLEPPIYTRPAVFRSLKVPDILLSGDHEKIKQWRYEQALIKTKKRRPDLLNE